MSIAQGFSYTEIQNVKYYRIKCSGAIHQDLAIFRLESYGINPLGPG